MKLYKIQKSKIDNKRGLYATKDIKEGTKIINYIGKIITNREVEKSAKFDNNKPIYLFTLNNRYTLDGDFHWNTAGLINHSCSTNCDYEGQGFKVWVSVNIEITFSFVFFFISNKSGKTVSISPQVSEKIKTAHSGFFLISISFFFLEIFDYFFSKINVSILPQNAGLLTLLFFLINSSIFL